MFILLYFQALDTFNTAVVSPIYYALFTSFTILASAIMFQVCPPQDTEKHMHLGTDIARPKFDDLLCLYSICFWI